MHSLYQELTDLSLPWVATHLFSWECFCLRFTDDDLRLVVRWIKDRKRNGRPAREFTFRGFIAGPSSLDFFAEDLAQAKSEARIPRKTERDRVLAQVGRVEPVRDTARPVGSFVKDPAGLKALLALRDSL
jgi:hypothetical protein